MPEKKISLRRGLQTKILHIHTITDPVGEINIVTH